MTRSMFRTWALLGAVVVSGALILGACGSDDSSSSSDETTTTDSPAGEAGGEATEFVGLDKDEAIAKAEKDGNPYRIASEDGEDFALTMDFNPERVNFQIEDGVVVQATWG